MGDILKLMGLPGADMAERLKQIKPEEVTSVNKIWETHDIRNQIVHQPNFHLTQEEAEKAVGNIEEALRELDYLPWFNWLAYFWLNGLITLLLL